jgi:hypothetical protein
MMHLFPGVSRFVFFSLLIGLSVAPAMIPIWADEASERQEKLNGGYFLLHQLSEDEAQLAESVNVEAEEGEVEAATFASRHR